MPRQSVVAGLVLLTALGGCELTSVEVAVPEDVVVAEVYLRPEAPAQHAFLYRTFTGEGEDRPRTVEGAMVRVVDRRGRAQPFRELLDPAPCLEEGVPPEEVSGTCYAADGTGNSGFVQPGEEYHLEIALPDGRTLEGTTTVPGTFDVRSPAEPTCALEPGSFDVVWTASAGAWSYQAIAVLTELAPGLRAQGVEDPPDTLELVGLAVGGQDTVIAFPTEFGVFDRFTLDRDLLLALQQGLPAGARAEVVIAAGDRNYVNWVRGGNFNPSGQVRVPSVAGDGTGVFAGLVTRERTFLSAPSEGIPLCR